MKKSTLGSGCFWCTEAVFKDIDGVENVVSGYAGGSVDNPTYREVCTGETGHAEVVQIHYNENVIKYSDILDIFFEIHNPETEDRQGPDVGSQYRSIILYHNQTQKTQAENKIEQIEGSLYDNVVTELSKLQKFYRAKRKHQDYFEKNPNSSYCQIYIPPKKSKVDKKFDDL